MCGFAGCYNAADAAYLTEMGLAKQQHRGQESVGEISSDGRHLYPKGDFPYRRMGLVSHELTPAVVRSMMGFMAFGHVRYSTQGGSDISNVQPHVAKTKYGEIFFASNGDIVNCASLRGWLKGEGVTFYSRNDGELIVKMVGYFYDQCGDLLQAIRQARRKLNGSYSGVLMTTDEMYLLRDPHEFRPFSLTVSPDGAVFFASETCALDIMTAIHPGFEGQDYELDTVHGNEIVQLVGGKILRHPDAIDVDHFSHCVFEPIYFARPDSMVFGIQAKIFRRRLAAALLREAQPTGTVIAGVPDSSTEAARELARLTGIRDDSLLVKSHYVGRTFIEPEQRVRDTKVQRKLNPDRRGIRDQEIILIDDSIVRGTTMRKIIGMMKRYGPTKITVLITCPMIMHFCYYGIDMKDSLIAQLLKGDVKAIKEAIGLEEHDELHFLSIEGLKSCVDNPEDWCFACLDGKYPTDVSEYIQIT